MKIKITESTGNPPGRVAEAELHFEPQDGPLAGLKLIGFGIWQRRGTTGSLNVTFPARQYAVNGERRSFALLRPAQDANSQNTIRDAILEAYHAQTAEQDDAQAPDATTPAAATASTETTRKETDPAFEF